MACLRCYVVVNEDPPLEPIGVCNICGGLACRRDGSRDTDYPQFICGMCEPARILNSSGLPPTPPPGPGGGGGFGGPAPPEQPHGPIGGAAAYRSSADFARRRSEIAEASRDHRAEWRNEVDRTVADLMQLGTDETFHAVLASRLEPGLEATDVKAIALLLSNQLQAADDRGTLDRDLFADALGVASWAIGTGPRDEPTVAQLAFLSEPRLRIALGYRALAVGA